MQPRMTQVPPKPYSSAIPTRAPPSAAMRLARTPPEPPPMTKRSKSYFRDMRPLDDFHPVFIGDDELFGDTHKKPVFHHTGHCAQRLRQLFCVRDFAKVSVVDEISRIGQ